MRRAAGSHLARPADTSPAPQPGRAPQPLAGRSPALLASLGAAFISPSAVLVTLAHSGAATTAFYRCALTVPLLVVLAGVEQRRQGKRPLRPRLQAVLAGLFLGVDLVLWNHAIAAVGAGIATLLGNLQVLFVALAAWALFRERPGRMFLLALPVVVAGVALVSGLADGLGGAGGAATGHPVAGIAYGLGTSVAYAAFLLILRQTATGTPHAAGPLAEATVGATAGSLLLGAAFGGLQLHIPWHSFGWLLLLAMSSQTAGWLLITSSLPRLPAAVSSLLLLLQPAAAIVLAAIVLGQRPSLLQLAGAVLVCGGVLAVSWSASAKRGQSYSGTERSDGAGSRSVATPPTWRASGPQRNSSEATSEPPAKMPADHQNPVV